jgi:ADP-heptose:LPS heptosyltransferase
MKFSISILCLNNLALTKRCLDSVFAAGSDVGEAELLIHDNGSTDGTQEYLKSIAQRPHVQVRRSDFNMGFIEPNRLNLADAKGEYFIMLNNDTVVPPDWLKALERPFTTFPKAALSGPEGSCSQILPNFHGSMGRKEYLEGSCLCCKTEIVREHGLFSPELVGAYGEDSDLSLRMRELGYTLHWVPLALQHTRGATSAMVPQARGWQDRNHEYLRRRWSHYLRVRRFDHPILIRRADAWGDVLLLTPILRSLKIQRPLSPIWIETNCGEVFRGNPNVARYERRIQPTTDTLCIDLNGSYEAMTDMHILDAYEHFTRTMLGGGFKLLNRNLEIFPNDTEQNKARVQMAEDAPWVVLHIGPVCWRSKEWGLPRFHALTAMLIGRGWKVALVGATKTGHCGCTIDFRGVTTIHEMAAIILRADLFIGLDSLPLHVAQAVGTPTIGLFGVTSSKFILTDPRAIGIDSDAETAGLRHRVTNQREVDDAGAAMAAISVDQVLEQVIEREKETMT